MSQFGRTIATAASSLTSRRHYSTRIALPPHAATVRSPPTSPSAALFSLLGHARSASQSSQPASPRSPMQICSPPRSPSQMQFAGPLSPSQLNLTFASASPFAQPSPPQTYVDFSQVVACTSSPAGPIHAEFTSSCSVSPVYGAAVPLPPLPRPVAGRKPTKKTKRDDDGQRKKPLNSFTYYRKIFPGLYPEIDALIPTQKERSTITGAIWQAEHPDIKEACRVAVQVERTPQKAERLEFVRQRMSTKRQQERAAAGTDRLQGRNLLIFQLWQERKTKEEIEQIVATWEDDTAAMAEPKRKRRRVAQPPAPTAPVQLMPSPPALEPLPFASPSPAFSLSTLPPTSSPAASTPAADFASPAPSLASLPAYDTFNPALPQEVQESSYVWPIMDFLAQGPSVPMPQVEDALALYLPHHDISEAAARLNAADPSTLPYSLGGEENLADLVTTYNYPEHYGPSPFETSGDEVGLTIELGSY
ncbi:hypothetical protein AURDEDRAFT_114326 [Auricularia subglabra TFB-10046 SS5]|nr:hypothetical protein AURDEDRAFT_114326 [Auricularia subglabra TFB-10046 SS5]